MYCYFNKYVHQILVNDSVILLLRSFVLLIIHHIYLLSFKKKCYIVIYVQISIFANYKDILLHILHNNNKKARIDAKLLQTDFFIQIKISLLISKFLKNKVSA